MSQQQAANQLQRLEQYFSGKRKGDPPDGWPEESGHVSFLVTSLELLRLLGFVIAVIIAFTDDDGNKLMTMLGGLLVLEIGYRMVRPDDRPLRKKLYRKGSFHHAMIVQCNQAAFSAAHDEPVAGTVVYSLDPSLDTDVAALRELAGKIADLKFQDRRNMAEDVGALAWRLYHEMCPNPRAPVPASLGAPAGTWLADVTLHPGDRTTELDSLPVLALADGEHWAVTQLVPGKILDQAGVS